MPRIYVEENRQGEKRDQSHDFRSSSNGIYFCYMLGQCNEYSREYIIYRSAVIPTTRRIPLEPSEANNFTRRDKDHKFF